MDARSFAPGACCRQSGSDERQERNAERGPMTNSSVVMVSSGSRPFERFSGVMAGTAADRLKPERFQKPLWEIRLGYVFGIERDRRDGNIIRACFVGQLVDAADHARVHRRDAVFRFGEGVGMALRRTAAHTRHIGDKTLTFTEQKVALVHGSALPFLRLTTFFFKDVRLRIVSRAMPVSSRARR